MSQEELAPRDCSIPPNQQVPPPSRYLSRTLAKLRAWTSRCCSPHSGQLSDIMTSTCWGLPLLSSLHTPPRESVHCAEGGGEGGVGGCVNPVCGGRLRSAAP